MKKQILDVGKALNRAEQKLINGGIDPISGGNGGGGSGSSDDSCWGVCIIQKPFGFITIKTHCNDLCQDGTQPICEPC